MSDEAKWQWNEELFQCCTQKKTLCITCKILPYCPMQHTTEVVECGLFEPLASPELIKKTPISFIEEEKLMEHADRIEITFKSGETISYGKGEWDDYAYDGKAVIVKQKGAWIGIYNFDHVFCVELKEK